MRAKEKDYEIYHIRALDGIRALAVGIVVWFHFWQQNWIIPSIGTVSLDWIPRVGYIMVDMMILLSGFCLFLPYARQMVYGEEVSSTKEFYKKRFARIAPSYYFSVFLVLFLFALPLKEFDNTESMWKDILSHVFFIHNFFPESYMFSKLNVVLWTVAVEVQYYLFFPLLAKSFQKKPLCTYILLMSVSVLTCDQICGMFDQVNQGMYVNHVLSFAGVYGNGMLGAWLYIAWTKNRERKKWEVPVFVLISLVCVILYKEFCMKLINAENAQYMQVQWRIALSLLYLVFILSVILSGKITRYLFGNRVMSFLAGISYNMYIWHQYAAVKLKEFRIPYWEGEIPPNQLGDQAWQWKYTVVCILVAFVMAIFGTYIIEKPIAKKLLQPKKTVSSKGKL